MGEILLAGEEAQKRPAFERNVIANRPAQHRVAGLDRVKDRTQRDRAFDMYFDLAPDVRQRSKMLWKLDSDHVRAIMSD
jgi:hypothetical protein